jgi:7-cyano-7-deazaguanine reductase
MTKYQHAKELQNLALGKSSEYLSSYAPTLLQAVPRALNRADLALGSRLPFIGEDVWYGYELSWLNNRGKPIVALAEFRFPCTNTNLIESKSFKLYLNSFNQTKFDSWQQVQQCLSEDLGSCAQGSVTVSLFKVDQCPALEINSEHAICLDDLDLDISDYQLNVNHLSLDPLQEKPVAQYLVSHLLKSNCLITNQPDWASVYINYSGPAICHSGLLKYLISFRQHNEFHEQCVERIFTDILRHCAPEQLTVFARYTRRGGLDINPFRSTHLSLAPYGRTLRQ